MNELVFRRKKGGSRRLRWNPPLEATPVAGSAQLCRKMGLLVLLIGGLLLNGCASDAFIPPPDDQAYGQSQTDDSSREPPGIPTDF